MQRTQIEPQSHHSESSRRTWIFIALLLSIAVHVGGLLLLADVGVRAGRSDVAGSAVISWVVLSPSAATAKPEATQSANVLEPKPTSPMEDKNDQRTGEAASPPVAPAPTYLPRGLLQQAPVPIGEIDPVYPEAAGGLSGRVVLRLHISESGAVDSAEVVSATRPGLFDKAAIDAFSVAKFEPGRALGRPVKSELLVEVAFATVNKGAVRDAIR